MATPPPPPPPLEPGVPGVPGEPSNRWPWVALVLGVLIIGAAVVFFLLSRPRTVNVTADGSATVSPVARAASPAAPPTLVPPTLPASATLAPSATPAPSPTQTPAPPTPLPAPTPAPTVQAAPPPQPTQPPPPPAQPAATAPQTAPQATPAPAASLTPAAPAAPPSPTPFAGQVASAGGLGNTRADFDAAYGPPAGETPEHLIAYRKGNFEYHVGFVPDPNGRAALLVAISQPPANAPPFTIEQAMTEAHKLLPRDAQPPNPPPEANPQFVVERYTSQTLAQALPADVFAANKGQPGQFLVVYVRDPAQSTRITRFIIGPGTDPNALITQGR
jgi:hypothetical protein